EFEEDPNRLLVPRRSGRQAAHRQFLDDEVAESGEVLVPVAERRCVPLRLDVPLRGDRDDRGPGGERFIHRALAARRDDEVRRKDVILEVRQESEGVHARLGVHLQPWSAHDDHRDLVSVESSKVVDGGAKQIVSDRRAAGGHEDRLLPKEQVLAQFLSGGAEGPDDRRDPPDVRPRRGVVEREDEIDLPGNGREPPIPVSLQESRGRILREIVAERVHNQRGRNVVRQGLANRSDFPVGEEEPIGPPVSLPSEEPSGDAQVACIVDVPAPNRLEDPVVRGPIGGGRRREGIEPAGHDEVEGRDAGQEEEVQILAAGLEAAGEGHGPRRMPEALGKGPESPRVAIAPADQLSQLLAYPVARIVVSALGDTYLTRRFALREAIAAEGLLAQDSDDAILHVAAQLPMDLRREDGGFRIHFSDFLRFTNTMRDAPWKLINQPLERGYVTLRRQKALRVLRNAVQRHIEQGLPLPVNDDIVAAFKSDLSEIRGLLEAKKATFKAEDIGKVSITRFPPCMYNLLAQIQNHENVPHM